jgi:multiple sugar transport system substrate-binding protein/sn-glycerol 3-phosphate transport system substrate-binding protein
MRKFSIFLTLVLAVALALPIFGVSAQEEQFVKTFDLPTEPAAEGPLAGVDPTGQTVVYWHQHTGSREEFMNSMVEEFNTGNPWQIVVEASNQGGYGDLYNKMVAGIQAGEVPNLVAAYQNNSAAYYQAGGLVEDMDVYVKDTTWGYNEAEVADFVPGFFNQDYTPDGAHRIGFPPNRSTEALYYNMTALQELGFDAPPASWQEFHDMACAFTENGWSGYEGDDAAGYTIRTDASFIAAATFASGGEIFQDGAFVFNNPETVDAIQFMVDLYNEGCASLIAEQYGDQNNFTAGKALFYIGSTSGLPFIRSGVEEAFAEPFEWGVGFIPYSDVPVQNVYGASVSIPATTPEAQLAAWLFVRWFSEPEQQARWAEISNYFPVRFSAQDDMQTAFDDFPQYGQAWDLIQGETKVEPQVASYDAIRNAEVETFETLLSSGGDVETALTDLTNTANEIMATFEVAPQ